MKEITPEQKRRWTRASINYRNNILGPAMEAAEAEGIPTDTAHFYFEARPLTPDQEAEIPLDLDAIKTQEKLNRADREIRDTQRSLNHAK